MRDEESHRSSSAAAAEEVVTGDIVAQLGYCPRRLHLMYAEGRWAPNVHTDEGTFVHRNAERGEQVLPITSDDGASLAVISEGVRARRPARPTPPPNPEIT